MTDPQLLTYLADKQMVPSPIAVNEDNHNNMESPFVMLSDSTTVSSPEISSPDIDEGNESDPDEIKLEIADSLIHNFLSETPIPLNEPDQSNTFANILSNVTIDILDPDLDSNQVITIDNQLTNIFIPDDLSDSESYDQPFSMVSENTINTPYVGRFADITLSPEDGQIVFNHNQDDQDNGDQNDVFGGNDELGINEMDSGNNDNCDDDDDDSTLHDEDWWISEEYYIQD